MPSSTEKTNDADFARTLAEAVKRHKAGDLETAKRLYQDLLDRDAENAIALGNLGALYLSLNRHGTAIEYLKRALRADPNQAPVRKNLGGALVESGDHRGAVESYQRATELNSQDIESWVMLSRSLARLSELDRANAAIESALALDPKSTFALNQAAGLCRDQLDLGKAEVFANRAIAIAPSNPNYHHRLGHILLHAGKFQEGWRKYE